MFNQSRDQDSTSSSSLAPRESRQNRFGLPDLGVGVGLRAPHVRHVIENWPAVDWFEVLTENYMQTMGRPLECLVQVAERYPIVLHGVSLSIGGCAPLDPTYLAELKSLRDLCGAQWVSDHVCFTGAAERATYDLLPIPYNDETLRHVAERVRIVQDYLEAPLVLENPTTYLQLRDSDMDEWTFLAELAREADCGLLLDVNNVLVSASNHGFDPSEYLAAMPYERVVQFHVAGHTRRGEYLLDSHAARVDVNVWRLLSEAVRSSLRKTVLLEWDENIPSFQELHREALRAAPILEGVT